MADEDRRTAVVARWLLLTRTVLPAMAAGERWPIRRDHCFMRVFLDHAIGAQWDTQVARPAIRCMAVADLERAVALAEAVLAAPTRLPVLNAQSLRWRQAQRRVRAEVAAGGGTLGGV